MAVDWCVLVKNVLLPHSSVYRVGRGVSKVRRPPYLKLSHGGLSIMQGGLKIICQNL